jgi:hypothetical protein
VHDGELSGESVFTPDPAFVERMEQMGFSGFDAEKLQAYAFVNVESGWARSLQQIGVHGMTTDNLIALRIFNVDPDYIHGITSLGYELPAVDQLIALKVQGVNRAEVSEIRALGYKPTLDELIRIRIFHITPDFIVSALRSTGTSRQAGCLKPFPLVGKPVRQFTFAHLRQVRKQLGEIQLGIYIVSSASAGQAGQDCRRSAATWIANEKTVLSV